MSKKQWLKYVKITVITAMVWVGIELLWTSFASTARPSTHLFEHQLKKFTHQDYSKYPITIVQQQVRPTEVWPFIYEKIVNASFEVFTSFMKM